MENIFFFFKYTVIAQLVLRKILKNNKKNFLFEKMSTKLKNIYLLIFHMYYTSDVPLENVKKSTFIALIVLSKYFCQIQYYNPGISSKNILKILGLQL